MSSVPAPRPCSTISSPSPSLPLLATLADGAMNHTNHLVLLRVNLFARSLPYVLAGRTTFRLRVIPIALCYRERDMRQFTCGGPALIGFDGIFSCRDYDTQDLGSKVFMSSYVRSHHVRDWFRTVTHFSSGPCDLLQSNKTPAASSSHSSFSPPSCPHRTAHVLSSIWGSYRSPLCEQPQLLPLRVQILAKVSESISVNQWYYLRL